ncbi:MAG TPA: hypothetical protein VFM37_12150 [Pseudonocardiaceae bacterium]|nr:hypothetical protein [Pseudonocardiaceae bacterium]
MNRNRRVAVTSPQTRLAMTRRRRERPWRRPQLSAVDAERARRLYLRQRAAALPALALLFGLLFGLPLALAMAPSLDQVRLGGIPVSWLLLAVLPYPAMLVLARWQLRRAERVEDDE